MTKHEFAECIAILEVGIGKPIAEGAGKAGETARDARRDVYYSLLGDLAYEVFKVAVMRVLCDHKWSTFPSIAELRQAAVQVMNSQKPQITPGEAWKLAQDFARRYDPEQSGPYMARSKSGEMKLFDNRAAWLLEGVPEIVVEAIRSYGFVNLSNTNAKFAMKPFLEIFEDLAAKEQRKVLLPASVQKPLPVASKAPMKAIGKIGEMK